MPKLREPIYQIKDKEIRALVAQRKSLKDVTNNEISKAIGCHINTLLNHTKHPEDFTLGELRKLFDFLEFSPEERSAVTSKEKYL